MNTRKRWVSLIIVEKPFSRVRTIKLTEMKKKSHEECGKMHYP